MKKRCLRCRKTFKARRLTARYCKHCRGVPLYKSDPSPQAPNLAGIEGISSAHAELIADEDYEPTPELAAKIDAEIQAAKLAINEARAKHRTSSGSASPGGRHVRIRPAGRRRYYHVED